MMVITAKFGGSSLADAAQFRKVADIIHANEARRYVVASAPGKRYSGDDKVTDLLLACYAAADAGEDIGERFEKIAQRFRDIIRDLEIDLSLEKEFENIRGAIMNNSGRDYVASRGEYLNSMVLAAYLGFDFMDAKNMIFFREDGSLDDKKTNTVLGGILRNHPHAVIPGFYGTMPNGTIRTFSRGGSDVTGSLVARAVQADLYENWTDVSGMLMADPRCVKNPLPIQEITYRELRELAYSGATVLHEDATFPVRVAGIPINIRNTNRPEDPGTMIVPTPKTSAPLPITGVAGSTGFSALYIEQDMMNAQIGYGRRVLSILERHNIPFEHLPSGIDTLSVVMETKKIASIKDQLIAELFDVISPNAVSIEDDLAVIAVVGRGMVGTTGVAARVFSALSRANINVRMIDQGSCELNIIIGVDAANYQPAIRAIYEEFAGPSAD